MLAAVLTFTFAATLIVLLPGPDTLVVVRNLIRGGRRTAVLTVAGVLSGLSVWVTAAALGLSALLRASHDGYLALRIAGAIYLAWLGVQSLRAKAVATRVEPATGLVELATGVDAPTGLVEPSADAVEPDTGFAEPGVFGSELGEIGKPPRRLIGTGYGAGLATDLLNPKVGVFFVTFLPGFVPHGHAVGTTSLVFGAIFVIETAMYFAALLMLAGRITRWMHDARIRRRLDRATGMVLIGFGVRLIAER
jgi:threonine/homoserine/homoserine lactone efflux protein